jgi:ubiquinone/menaquinone biosynthesis C-methylase UbiE
MNCLEIGCGSGDVAFDLARIVGPADRVVATDIDEIKLQLARQQAAQDHLCNLEFRSADILTGALERFDFVHARFVLTHLADPRKALKKVRQAMPPGINLVQLAAMSDESKLMAPLTMESIADSVLAEGLASHAEVDRLMLELYEFAHDPNTIISGPG